MGARAAVGRGGPRGPRGPRHRPDGGWGWMVVFGVSISYMTNMALFSVFSLMFGMQLADWGLHTTGIAVINSTMTAIQNFSGLLVGPLVKRLGSKTVSLMGASLVFCGMTLSFFAQDPWHVFITWSFLVGLGVGLLVPSTFLGISAWFSTRRSQAVGITLAGTGLGQMLLPHLVRLLIGEYGSQGCWLIVGALALHAVPGCLLYRKPARTRPSDPEEPSESQPLRSSSPSPPPAPAPTLPPLLGDKGGKADKAGAADMSSLARNGGGGGGGGGAAEEQQLGPVRRMVRAMDLDLLWNARFMNLAVGSGLVYTTATSFSMIFPLFLMEGVGLTLAATATCMSVQSGADLVSRLLLPQLMAGRLAARTVMLVGAVGSACSRSVMAELSGYTELIVMSAVTGFFRGATVLNQNLVIAEHVPPAKLPAAIGMAMVVKGVCVLSIGSTLGVVRDMTQSFSLFVHSLTLLAMVTAASWILESMLCPLKRR